MAKSFREIDEEYEQKLAEQHKKIGERWAERQRRYADPTRMSREQYQHVMFGNAYDKNGLMAHEKDMLREKSAADLELQGKKNEGELAVAKEKRAGMREQGADAAQATAEAAMKTAELEWATKKGIAEMDAETKKDVAGMELEGKKYGYNQDLEGKKYVADKNLEIAKTQGEYGVMQQAEANKGLTAQAEIKRQQQERQIAATLEKAKIVAGGKVDAAKINGQAKTINTAIETGIAAGKDLPAVMAELTKQYQGDSEMLEAISAIGGGGQSQQSAQPKEGDTKTLSSGTKVVFRNGQWVKA